MPGDDSKGWGLKKNATILVADRNPYVRELILRELRAEGYQVLLAKNGTEIIEHAFCGRQLDLLVLDLEVPNIEETSLVVRLKGRRPPLPVVVHGFISDYETHGEALHPRSFVKKKENSIDDLKRIIPDILNEPDKTTTKSGHTK